MSKLCNCCRQPIDGDPAGTHRGEPVCRGCADELQRCGIEIQAIDTRRFGPDKHEPVETDGDE